MEGTAHAWCVGCWVSDIIIRGCDVRSMHYVVPHMAVILALIREGKRYTEKTGNGALIFVLHAVTV